MTGVGASWSYSKRQEWTCRIGPSAYGKNSSAVDDDNQPLSHEHLRRRIAGLNIDLVQFSVPPMGALLSLVLRFGVQLVASRFGPRLVSRIEAVTIVCPAFF